MRNKKYFRPISILLIWAFLLFPQYGYSLPVGEQVVSGSASFDRSVPNTLNINVGTNKLITNYDSFSIAGAETVNFLQPSATSVALNRVIGIDPSSILGKLSANGKIFLVNPNGILFGPGCRLDTNGMVASTLNIADNDFLAGRYTFTGPGGSVLNQGYISAPGGYVALLGSSVENSGIIEANLGTVALASGQAMTLNLDPNGLIAVVIDEASVENLDNKEDAVKNSGTILADGGRVLLSAKALEGVFNKAVNTDGIIEANVLNGKSGEIIIEADQRVNIAGAIEAIGGKVSVDSCGADYSGSINAAEGIYNANDGDTYISGSYTGDDQTWADNVNIYVNDNLAATGSLEFVADADDNGTGEFGLYSGKTLSSGGTISITAGENIWFGDNSIVTANGPITLLAGENIIQGYNSVITGTRLASFVTGSLDSDLDPNQWYNHDDDGYSDINKPVVDFTWRYFVDPATDLPAFTATATNGNYEMYKGSSVRTNGGNIEINAKTGWLHINSGSTYRGLLNAGAGTITLRLGKNLVVNELSSPTFRAADGSAGVFIWYDNNLSKNVKPAAFANGSSDPVHLAFDASFKLGSIDGILGPITVRDETSDTEGLCGVLATASQEGDAWIFTVSDGSGGGGSLYNFMFDWTPPVITQGTPTGTAGLNGWYRSNVIVPFSATDNLSGFSPDGALSTDLTSQTVYGEGTNLYVTSEGIADLAGNLAEGIDSGLFNIDWTPPVITQGTPTGTKGTADTWISDVTVPFSATDNLSGFAPNGDLYTDLASKTTTGEGTNLYVTSDGIVDLAGNFAEGIPAGPFIVQYPREEAVILPYEELRKIRVYYEILDPHRVMSIDPATPTTFFAYHPLLAMDSSAFEAIALDVGAYDFIENSINLKRSLAPYFGVEVEVEQGKKKKK